MADLWLYFQGVATQVAVIFVLIGVGVLLTRRRLISEVGARVITDVILYAVTPAVILKAFLTVRFSPENAQQMLLALASALAVHALGLGLGLLVFGRRPKPSRSLLTGVVIFANGGFMALPLAQALLGDKGVFLVSMYVAVFNVVIWTLGVKLFSAEPVSAKKLLLNPNLIAVALGIVLFFLRVDLTGVTILFEPMTHLANLNTPLAMLLIGYYLAHARWLPSRADGPAYVAITLRLLAVPLVALAALRLCGMTGDLLTACVLPASAPVAAMTMMFAARFGGDTETASRTVALSHVMSILTIPLMLTLAKAIG